MTDPESRGFGVIHRSQVTENPAKDSEQKGVGDGSLAAQVIEDADDPCMCMYIIDVTRFVLTSSPRILGMFSSFSEHMFPLVVPVLHPPTLSLTPPHQLTSESLRRLAGDSSPSVAPRASSPSLHMTRPSNPGPRKAPTAAPFSNSKVSSIHLIQSRHSEGSWRQSFFTHTRSISILYHSI
jgi:hypothetical protein